MMTDGSNSMSGALGTLISRYAERVKATNSVMSPLQWILPVIMTSSLVAMGIGPEAQKPLFGFLFLGTPIFYGLIYAYFVFRDPDRLQTEQHREHMTQLNRYEDDRGVVILDGSSANTAPPYVVSSSTDGEHGQ